MEVDNETTPSSPISRLTCDIVDEEKQNWSTIKASHDKHKNDKKYMKSLVSSVNDIVVMRLKYMRMMNMVIYASYMVVLVVTFYLINTSTTINNTPRIITAILNTMVLGLGYALFIAIPSYVRANLQKDCLNPVEKRQIAFGTDLVDTWVVAFLDPRVVAKLVPNGDDIRNLGGLMKHPWHKSVSIKEDATTDETGAVVMVHALKLCLLNALEVCVK